MIYTRLRATLSRWRDDAGYSYSELARKTGLSAPGIWKALDPDGSTIPSQQTITLLCAALGHTEEDLLREAAEGE